jgi:cellulose synthase/poly-beta-1,6-N-acetylglucosamine synthase-like glycosyltransferase
VFLTLFLTLAVALGAATLLLVTLGHRVRFSFAPLGVLLAVGIALGAGELVSAAWHYPPAPILVGESTIVVLAVLVSAGRRQWNPIGQMFLATFIAAAGAYLVFALYWTFSGSLPVAGIVASLILFALEVLALCLAGYFVFEGCDVICRTKPARPNPAYDPDYTPFVTLQVPAYNEPPDMLMETIASLDGIDYPKLEILVIDNNTKDPDLWRPVEDFCRDRPRVRFLHVEDLPGFKSGALNWVNRDHLNPATEIFGVVDADYRVEPNFLTELVGYFADPKVAFVQTPQDYREWKGNTYMTACYDAYNYFFVTSMPSRMQRNSIIFAGTMGLMRRSALEEVGGWPEWCITEDAETSLRLLKRGYDGVYVQQRYGNGIMPLTFSAFKSQRFRWAFGGVQIFKKHWRSLLPGPRTEDNRLTIGQRVDYLMSGLLWFNDVLYLGFAVILVSTAFILAAHGHIELRPLHGAIAVLPGALIASGLVRALWSLRVRAHLSVKRGIFAFLNWLSLSWTVALACIQHLFKSESTFLRTPKEGKERTFLGALRAARTEAAFMVVLWGAPIALGVLHRGTWFVYTLFVWQGLVYASALFMSWLNVRGALTPELERRRQSETLRDRLAAKAPYYAAAATVIGIAAVVFALVGSQTQPRRTPELLKPPSHAAIGPISFLTNKAKPSPTPSASPSATASATPFVPAATPAPATAAPAPTVAPTPAPTAAAAVTPAPS